MRDQRAEQKDGRESMRRLLLVFSALSFFAILGLPFAPLLSIVSFCAAETLFVWLYLRLRRRRAQDGPAVEAISSAPP